MESELKVKDLIEVVCKKDDGRPSSVVDRFRKGSRGGRFQKHSAMSKGELDKSFDYGMNPEDLLAELG